MKIGAFNAQVCEVFQMSPFSTSTQNQSSDKAACPTAFSGLLRSPCGIWVRAHKSRFGQIPLIAPASKGMVHGERSKMPPSAINLGDDVAAQTTAAPAYAGDSAEAGAAVAAPSAVPVGNTGTTSTGHEL